MKKFILIFTVLAIILASCNTNPNPRIDHTYSHSGVTNNVNIVTKDFESLGIIFVNSVEVIDSLGNHTGSKITYEMFMREAAKLKADDIINIKIDANQMEKKVKSPEGVESKVTTFFYTGTALAIKYTTAARYNEARAFDKNQDISPSIGIPKDSSKKESVSKAKNALIFSGVLLAIGGAYLTAAFL